MRSIMAVWCAACASQWGSTYSAADSSISFKGEALRTVITYPAKTAAGPENKTAITMTIDAMPPDIPSSPFM